MKVLAIPSWIKISARYLPNALKEFIYLVAFALMPIWLGSIIRYAFGISVIKHLNNYLINGEALLLCSATIGPLIYLIVKNYDENSSGYSRSFPGKIYFIIVILVVCLISAAIIGLQESKGNYINYSENPLWTLSIIIVIISIVTWFFVSILKFSLETSSPSIMRQDTQDFINDWKQQ